MRLFALWLVFACASALADKKPEILRLKDGPVRGALKKGYRIHLARDFLREAEQELEKRLPKPKTEDQEVLR
ncbi:MAG: hypothetical protein JKY15_04325 [Deltaproteobacteria bacterium]|nr:hypothetical protein [Deltaproteobacteria bacterium]